MHMYMHMYMCMYMCMYSCRYFTPHGYGDSVRNLAVDCRPKVTVGTCAQHVQQQETEAKAGSRPRRHRGGLQRRMGLPSLTLSLCAAVHEGLYIHTTSMSVVVAHVALQDMTAQRNRNTVQFEELEVWKRTSDQEGGGRTKRADP